jgi:hypothetical protein
MDVTGSVGVSLGSSTVQLHGSLGSRRACSEAGFSSQNGDRAWGVSYWRAAFCCAFNEKGFHKKKIMFTVGSVCRVELFTTGWQVFPWEVETEVRKWPRRQSRRLLCRGFRRTGKAMRQVYQCWWRICREINIFFFFRFDCQMFYVLYPFVAYLLTLPRKKIRFTDNGRV